MDRQIDAFGGDGAHEVHFQNDAGEQTVWVKRDLWFDRSNGAHWLVWAQHRPWSDDEPLREDDPEARTLGAIKVTDPAVIAFLDQLGELLVNPAAFAHEPAFGPDAQEPDRAE